MVGSYIEDFTTEVARQAGQSASYKGGRDQPGYSIGDLNLPSLENQCSVYYKYTNSDYTVKRAM